MHTQLFCPTLLAGLDELAWHWPQYSVVLVQGCDANWLAGQLHGRHDVAAPFGWYVLAVQDTQLGSCPLADDEPGWQYTTRTLIVTVAEVAFGGVPRSDATTVSVTCGVSTLYSTFADEMTPELGSMEKPAGGDTREYTTVPFCPKSGSVASTVNNVVPAARPPGMLVAYGVPTNEGA